MAYTFQVVLDSTDPHPLADWWADALGWQVEQTDEAFVRRMVDEGHAAEADTTTHNGALVWKAGAGVRDPDERPGSPRLLVQLVPEGKTVKNRMHLDIRAGEDTDDLVTRLVSAGATKLHDGAQGPYTWVTLADPHGNEFCVAR